MGTFLTSYKGTFSKSRDSEFGRDLPFSQIELSPDRFSGYYIDVKRLWNSVYQKIFPSKAEYPVSVNFFKRKVPSDLLLRHHREVEIQFIKRGLGAYIIGRRQYQFGKNSVLVVKPCEKHCYMHWPGQCIEKITLIFS